MKFRYGSLVVMLILAGAVLFFNRKEISLTQVGPATLQSISRTGSEITTSFHFKNHNLLSATLQRFDLTYQVNDQIITTTDIPFEQGIPGLKTSSFPVSVRFSNSGQLKKNDTIYISGTVYYRNMVSEKQLPVSAHIPLQ